MQEIRGEVYALKLLILGASGMLGHAVMRTLFDPSSDIEVYGAARSSCVRKALTEIPADQFVIGFDAEKTDDLIDIFARIQPDVVVNCIGVVKQLEAANNPLTVLPLNTMLPHRLARLCASAGARLIHISTDCVFSGTRGRYLESDTSDATDLYGKSKYLGEVTCANSVTLRTSIIGHELNTSHSLIEWFLRQQGDISGYTKAIFSGLPTIELARVIRDFVLPNPRLSGLYHVAAAPISKYDLLNLVAQVYGKSIKIIPNHSVVIDRSLNGQLFAQEAGYHAPDWPQLIQMMYEKNK